MTFLLTTPSAVIVSVCIGVSGCLCPMNSRTYRVLVPLHSNLCRVPLFWLQLPKTSLPWLFAILWRPHHCWVVFPRFWTWKSAHLLCFVHCFWIGTMRCCALLVPCHLHDMLWLRLDASLQSQGIAWFLSLYFLLGLPVVWQAFLVLVALRRPHILRSIGMFKSLLEHMSFLLCSMGPRCHGLLRIGDLRQMLAWHLGWLVLWRSWAFVPKLH